MDITFYVIVVVAALILLLAMWACAASDVPKWGPDLTSELPPHILKEVFLHQESQKNSRMTANMTFPSCPTDSTLAPLLTNAQPISKIRRPAPPPPPPPKKALPKSTPVKELSRQFEQTLKLKPRVYSFTRDEPA